MQLAVRHRDLYLPLFREVAAYCFEVVNRTSVAGCATNMELELVHILTWELGD